MTTLAHRVSETPMAPYLGIMRGMNINDINAVIEFLKETVREAEESRRKADDEFLAKKMAEIEISPEVIELFDALRLTPEEAADERTRWILGLDRK
ncbi:MAG: hypothetical protein J6S87_01215 [Bacteroidales bacterium]|nr:hypothetical protein [Bacteroidales bacterium]